MKKFKSFFLHKILKFLPVLGIFFISACKVDGNDSTEETFQLMNSPAGCFSCQLFRVVYNAAAQISANAYLKLCDIALSLLVIGLTAWLFLHVLSIMVSLREPNLSKFWVDLFQKLFKGGFVAILIASKERLVEVINTIFEPIMLIFIDLSSTILRNNWASKRTALVNTLNSSFNVGPGFNRQIAVQLENLIYRITLALNFGFVMGIRLLKDSDFYNFCMGVVMVCVFMLLILFFPFYILDGIIRLVLVFTLLPLFLVAWVFRYTEHYLKKAWGIFMGALAQVMVACVFVAICVTFFEGYLSLKNYGYLTSAYIQNVDRTFYAEADQTSLGFLTFLVLTFYMYNMSKNIGTITTHFTGAPNSKAITDIVGRMKKLMSAAVMATVALVALPVAAPVAKAAAEKAKKDAADSMKGGK